MAPGAYHYGTAEELLDQAAAALDRDEPAVAAQLTAQAQVHASLAQAAALSGRMVELPRRPLRHATPPPPPARTGTRPYTAVPAR